MKQKSMFNLDTEIVLALDDYSTESMVTKSKLVNKLLRDFLIKEGKIKIEKLIKNDIR